MPYHTRRGPILAPNNLSVIESEPLQFRSRPSRLPQYARRGLGRPSWRVTRRGSSLSSSASSPTRGRRKNQNPVPSFEKQYTDPHLKGNKPGWNRSLLPCDTLTASNNKTHLPRPSVPVCTECLRSLVLNAPSSKNLPLVLDYNNDNHHATTTISRLSASTTDVGRPFALRCGHVLCSQCLKRAQDRCRAQRSSLSSDSSSLFQSSSSSFPLSPPPPPTSTLPSENKPYTLKNYDAVPLHIEPRKDPHTFLAWTKCPVTVCDGNNTDLLSNDPSLAPWELFV